MAYAFNIGAPVLASDGKAGRLKYVVVDADTQAITDLVIERGQVLKRAIVVPVSWVLRTDAQGIHLNARLFELDALPEYQEVEFAMPDSRMKPVYGHSPADVRLWVSPYRALAHPGQPVVWQRVRTGLHDDEVLLTRGLPVETNDGQTIGTIDHMLADPKTRRLTHVIVRRQPWSGDEDFIVSAEHIGRISEQGIRLTLGRADVAQLPRYQPAASDTQIRTSLIRGLETQPETRGQPLQVEVERGLVRLLGEVPASVAAAAAQIARHVRGVIGVFDETTRPQKRA